MHDYRNVMSRFAKEVDGGYTAVIKQSNVYLASVYSFWNYIFRYRSRKQSTYITIECIGTTVSRYRYNDAILHKLFGKKYSPTNYISPFINSILPFFFLLFHFIIDLCFRRNWLPRRPLILQNHRRI